MLPYTTWWKSSYLFSYSRFDQIKGKQRSSTCILPKPASTSAHQGNILGSTSILLNLISPVHHLEKITNMYIIFNPDFPTSRIIKLSSIKKRKKNFWKFEAEDREFSKCLRSLHALKFIQWKVRWIFKTEYFFSTFFWGCRDVGTNYKNVFSSTIIGWSHY